MARQRRGGFKPPELRGTLGTLLRSTLQQAGDVLERGARAAGAAASEARSRFEDARANRSRHDALAELGEIVLDLIRRGEIDVGELPEAEELVRHLEELDAEGKGERGEEIAQAPSRRRFDDRKPAREDEDDDGTVSSGARPRRAAAPTRVWRPVAAAAAPPEEPPARRAFAPDPHRKGGIAFDDEDLADYMHPDDVPPKPAPDGDP